MVSKVRLAQHPEGSSGTGNIAGTPSSQKLVISRGIIGKCSSTASSYSQATSSL
ncbi:hypothetical protein L917_14113 [Phytophthora nicotianae]|uniref:Uncharacterized protein n=1 Tax=Phytophthora nicotianae TaxID=4792 RepID=W2MTG6_PHYNI|nr:hypothetical protein L916_14315 [Phytophthora nicotianae]ETL86455.1 hypothetical protein L917_14113 [Phytophthora nicotianae]ETM39600.1 hypothetical protein L914_14258 [Phytophthora nicotianae]